MDTIYKRFCITGDIYFEYPQFLREILFKLNKKYGYKLKIFSRGYNYGADKWIKKLSMEFEIKYNEFNPAYTGYNGYSYMPPYYFKNKTKKNYTHILHANYLAAKNSDELVFFKSKNQTLSDYDKNLIQNFDKLNKKILIIKK